MRRLCEEENHEQRPLGNHLQAGRVREVTAATLAPQRTPFRRSRLPARTRQPAAYSAPIPAQCSFQTRRKAIVLTSAKARRGTFSSISIQANSLVPANAHESRYKNLAKTFGQWRAGGGTHGTSAGSSMPLRMRSRSNANCTLPAPRPISTAIPRVLQTKHASRLTRRPQKTGLENTLSVGQVCPP